MILGIDTGITAASPTALALYDPARDQVVMTRRLVPSNDKAEVDRRVGEIARRVLDAIDEHLPEAVAYEMPHFVENHQTTIKLAKVCGAIAAMCALRGVACIAVQPTQAKVALTGNARAAKGDMQTAALQQFGRKLSSHEADAIGVAIAGWAEWKQRRMR